MNPSVLRVMSFNIRNSDAPDGQNHWTHRRDLWVQSVRAFDPDLLGVQEVLADQYDELHERFADYDFVGVARDDGARSGEWAAILFRRDRFERLAGGDFWLSLTPEVVGSKSWDSKHVRICTWVRLRDRQSRRVILFANTHLDDMGVTARHEAAKLLSAKLPQLSDGASIILTGDFNSTEFDKPYAALVHPAQTGAVGLLDSYRTLHRHRTDEESSFHGFNGGTRGHRIDWILHTGELTPIEAEIRRDRAGDGRWPSDHYAVTTVFKL
jgi:endonuclease/exonuclease/phosphatase family metal-dependent hydrolase